MTIDLLLHKITIDNIQWLAGTIILLTLLIRIILNLFKVSAIRQGEADIKADTTNDIEEKLFSKWGRWEVFWKSFCSWGHHANIDDYGLPTMIGTIEMFIYSILISIGEWTFIGVLIGLKTAAQWTKWHKTRTVYNRFLLGNWLVIIASLFISISFLKIEDKDKIKPITTQSIRPSPPPNGVGSGG